MYSPTPLPTSVASGLISRSFLRRYFLLPSIAWLALSAETRAVSPTPDGGYAGNNTAEGNSALFSLSSGADNTAIGFQALFHNTSGTYNSGEGFRALFSNTTGNANTGNGVNALFRNTTGGLNTATGVQALFNNTTGGNNTASGYHALFSNTTGQFNNAVGANALPANVDGVSNNALGESALFSNIHGGSNTAVGDRALANNDSTGNDLGNANTAVGAGALSSNTDGDSNNAVGFNALGGNVDGLFNNAVGFDALADNVSGAGNVAIGDSAGAGVEGDFNIYIGAFAGPAPSPAPVSENETIRIGDVFNVACYIGGIRGTSTANANAVPVVIDSAGQLGTVSSSRRFKDEIKPMDNSSEAILGLKPVTFHYKTDKQNTPQFGLIAEEVAKMNPDLVVRDDNGEIYTVRYEAVNAMLLNEFLKEHRRVEEQRAYFELKLAQQQKQIEALTATIQKVSNQVALSRPAPQLVANH
jgi:hypothetical protein